MEEEWLIFFWGGGFISFVTVSTSFAESSFLVGGGDRLGALANGTGLRAGLHCALSVGRMR